MDTSPTDENLETDHVGEAAKDDRYEEWFRVYRPSLNRFCYRLLGSRAAAEDVTQETLLRCWLHRRDIRPAEVHHWLRAVARNLCVSTLRAEARTVPLSGAHDQPAGEDHPTRIAENVDLQRALHTAFRALPERQRRLFFLRHVGRWSYAELAASEGATEQTTRAVLSRARRKLVRQLDACSETLLGGFLALRLRFRSAFIRVRSTIQATEGLSTPLANTWIGVFLGLAALAGSVAQGSGLGDGHGVHAPIVDSTRAVATRWRGHDRSIGADTPIGGAAPRTANDNHLRIGAHADRSHRDVVVGADAPNPITGSDEGLWYHAWFEDDGKPSPVTEMTLRMVDELCDAGRGLCEPIDQLLQGGP